MDKIGLRHASTIEKKATKAIHFEATKSFGQYVFSVYSFFLYKHIFDHKLRSSFFLHFGYGLLEY
jgi:hypothetical protein